MPSAAPSLWGFRSNRLIRLTCRIPGCTLTRSSSARSIHNTNANLMRMHFRSRRQPSILPKTSSQYPSPPPHLDPNTVTTRRQERQLLRSRVFPVGSRRRRAVLKQMTQSVPFELLPYQCFQEARKVLLEDRQDKINQIELARSKIQRARSQAPTGDFEKFRRDNRVKVLERHMERLKILADVNDPLVKKRFEDAMGDMDRPIYRHLAQRKWASMKKKILEQRVTQMHLVPDILPNLNITADIEMQIHGKKDLVNKRVIPRLSPVAHRAIIQPGEFVASKVSEEVPHFNVQVFDKGTRFVTIAIIDGDVPDLDQNSFTTRCHFLAVNIPLSPTSPLVRTDTLSAESQIVFPWMAPYSVKGGPYHRLNVCVLQQASETPINIKDLNMQPREGFKLRKLASQLRLTPITATLFRTQWDEWMDDVMLKYGYEGVGMEFKRKRVEPLPYKKRDGARFR